MVVKQLIAGVAVAMALGFAAVSCTRPTDLPFPIAFDVGATTSVPAEQPPLLTSSPATSAPRSTTTRPASTTAVSQAVPTTVPTTSPTQPPGVLVIGDSILEGLNVLGYRFGPNTEYDTKVARSVLELDEVLADHEPPSDLVIHLGTNGWWPTTQESFSSTLTALGDRRIALVNVSVDRTYTDLANTDLASLAQTHDHVTLVDWHAIAAPEILRDDGYHPNLDGYERLAQLIADALGRQVRVPAPDGPEPLDAQVE